MEWPLVLLIIFGSLAILMATGLPVAFAFMLVNIVGVALLWGGGDGLRQLSYSMWTSVATFMILPLPMFVLLGEVLFRSGMAMRAIDAIEKWMGRLPGRLGLLAVGAATMFSTMSGSSLATTVMLGDALIPEMEKRGYKKPISIGAIMGSGGLAMLIPPSALAVLWASIAEVSIGEILIAGVIPGLIIAVLYATYVIVRCWLQPSIAPAYDVEPTPLAKKLDDAVKYVLPLGLIVFMVTGLIFLGVAAPSEAAAMGALASIILAAAYRKLNWDLLKSSFLATLKITVMALLILSGTKGFGQILAYTGAARELVSWVTSMPLAPIAVIIAMMFILLLMGTFMSAFPMMMITLPIFMPIIYNLGFSPVWFGLLFLLNLEMGQTTPPFGLLLFAMKGVAPPDTTMGDIIRAGIPFLLCDAVVMALIIAFPILATMLPNLLR